MVYILRVSKVCNRRISVRAAQAGALEISTDWNPTFPVSFRILKSMRSGPTLRAILIAFASIWTASSARVEAIEVYTDNFDTSHDYSGGNISGTIWNGMLFNSGFLGTQNATLVTANANTTNAGQLTVTSQNAGWDGGSDNGFALYRNVTGDFEATVQVTGATVADYNDMGLMARVANSADAGAGEDYVLLRYFAGFGYMGTRSVDNNAQTDFGFPSGLRSYSKLQRSGNVFTFTMASDAAFTQGILTTSITRNDFEGLALQVGIWQAGFTSTQNTARFDNFSLSAVPEPSGLYLGALGVAAVSLITKRRKGTVR